MNQSSSLKQMVSVEYMGPSVFKPELTHSSSQRPSQGTPSSAPPCIAAQSRYLSLLWCNHVPTSQTYLSIV